MLELKLVCFHGLLVRVSVVIIRLSKELLLVVQNLQGLLGIKFLH